MPHLTLHTFKSLHRGVPLRRLVGLLLLTVAIPGTLGAQETPAEAKGFLIESRPSGATVTIEGEIIGKTPCTFPYQLSGRYRLFAEKRGFETVSRDIDFGARKIDKITFLLSPKTRKWAAARSLVMTGWGQKYSEQIIKSRVFFALEASSLAALGYAHDRAQHFNTLYTSELDQYARTSTSMEKEAAGWKRLNTAYDDWKKMDRLRRAMIYTAAGVHALNLLDALFVFPKNLRQIEFLAQPGTGSALPESSGFMISYTIPL
ncbi:MAG TPA: PEGA domain-containing protein [bacterium]|nr:PEGA domain-containing protein [bacterium]